MRLPLSLRKPNDKEIFDAIVIFSSSIYQELNIIFTLAIRLKIYSE